MIPPRDQTKERTFTDSTGVVWTVTEAYEFVTGKDDRGTRPPEPRIAMLWFETQSGRTASALIPGQSLAALDDEDLLEFLHVAIQRRGRQP